MLTESSKRKIIVVSVVSQYFVRKRLSLVHLSYMVKETTKVLFCSPVLQSRLNDFLLRQIYSVAVRLTHIRCATRIFYLKINIPSYYRHYRNGR